MANRLWIEHRRLNLVQSCYGTDLAQQGHLLGPLIIIGPYLGPRRAPIGPDAGLSGGAKRN